jgi:predicted DNA-binding protein YlxM (UPF0122 family)
MSTLIKNINIFFKKAVKKDVDAIKSNIVLSDRQKIIFDMFYIKKQNIDFIADSLCVCRMVVNNELKIIREKIAKILEL